MEDEHPNFAHPVSQSLITCPAASVLLKRSMSPSVFGWNAVVFTFLMPIRLQISAKSFDMKAAPLSDNNSHGTPCQLMTSLTNNLAMVGAD